MEKDWWYRDTLQRCIRYLIEEYTIRSQVDELVNHLFENELITYHSMQYIFETQLTTDKMQYLINSILHSSHIKAAYYCLIQNLKENGRDDIVAVLLDTLEIVKKRTYPPKEENVVDLAARVKRGILKYFSPQDIQTHMEEESVSTSADLQTTRTSYDRLVEACYQGDTGEVDVILEQSPQCINTLNSNGQTVFMLACQNSDVNVINTLLESNLVNVNETDNQGRSAVMICILRGDIGVLSAVLDCPASYNLDLSISDNDGLTYLSFVFGELLAEHLPILALVATYFTDVVDEFPLGEDGAHWDAFCGFVDIVYLGIDRIHIFVHNEDKYLAHLLDV